MDASMTDAAHAELAELRRRAYGPGSDGGLDAVDAARLRELESLARPASPAFATAGRAATPTPSTPSRTEASVGGDSARAAEADPSSAVTTDQEPTSPSRPSEEASTEPPSRPVWWRRRMVWVAAVAAVAGIAIGAGVPALLAPRPTAVLGIVKGSFDTSDTAAGSIIEYLNLKPKTLRKLEAYGGIQGWIGASNDGSTCLLLTPTDPSTGTYFYGASCTPAGMDWVVDVRLTQDTQDLHLPPPVPRIGSVLRFQGHGDRVDLWIDEAPPAST
jgi:hypothetical protein